MINIILDKIQKTDYAKFKNTIELRTAVNQHVRTIEASKLSAAWKRKLIRLLDYLRDISREYPGLSFRKQRTIAADFGVKKPDTIGVWLKKLASLGIINILPTKRSSTMQQTVNLVQILPVEPTENKKGGQASEENGEHEVNISSKTNTVINNTYGASPCRPFYHRFKEFIASTIGGDQALVSRLFGVYKAHSTPLTKYGAFDQADVEHAGYEALKTSVMATKAKRIRNLAGYYSSVLDRILDKLYIKSLEHLA